jgi:hypothetical protein
VNESEIPPRAKSKDAKGEKNRLVWFTKSDLAELRESARRLRDDPMQSMGVISQRWMEDTELMHAVERKLLEQAGSAKKLETALKMVIVAMRVHDSKQEMTKPMVRRIMDQLRGKSARAKAQLTGHGRLGVGPGDGGGGGEGQPRPDTDPIQGRRNRFLDGRSDGMEVSDGEGSGHGGSDPQDD